ncbi:MAG: hypothetical protein HOP19_27560, partial [Acidobacteria bacterium]|nr:hypothetical protein [Acidobacteriota bacterium]
MAVVNGIREKVHMPLYDAITVKKAEQWRKEQGSSTLKFFVDVQGKTKLETNMQSASQLSHYNTFEARAMRVVMSDLPPEFSDEVIAETDEDTSFDVFDDSENENQFFFDTANNKVGAVDLSNTAVLAQTETGFVQAGSSPIEADVEISLDQLVKLLQEARDSDDGYAALFPDDEEISLSANGNELSAAAVEWVADHGGTIWLSVADLEALIEEIDERERPLLFQTEKETSVTKFINKFIYNTVTTFYVGEKIMIQMPTYYFPSGAGALNGHSATHGEPDPMATFRFAEPINIAKQQN